MPKIKKKSHAEEVAEEIQHFLFSHGPFDVVTTVHIVGDSHFRITLTDDDDDQHVFEVKVTKLVDE